MKVGTLAWARKTGGKLRPVDRAELARQFMTVRLAQRQRRGTPTPAPFDPEAVRIPDSAIARKAALVCETLSEPWLVNHAYRAYFWGTYLAKASALSYDEELLFVACILHDLGLTEACKPVADELHCFGVIGARRAVQAMARSGWDAWKLEALEEAITLHLNVAVPPSDGTEAHLLHEGTTLDVMGARFDELSRDYLAKVLEQFPRANTKGNMAACGHYEVAVRPKSRMSYLFNNGFEKLIRAAPFAE